MRFIGGFVAAAFALTAFATAYADTPASNCIILTHNLYFGTSDASTGGEVTVLQSELSKEGFLSVSPSGYFGPLTQAALQEWQASRGLVTSGNPVTTGFGFAGPRSRAVFNCSVQSPLPPTSTSGGISATSLPPVSFETSTLSVTEDSATHPVIDVAAATKGNTLDAISFHANGESVNLTKVSLSLSRGTPGDLSQVTLYYKDSLVGYGSFVGNSTSLTITLIRPVTVGSGGDALLVVKGDVAPVGIGQAAIDGDTITVQYAGAEGVGMASGNVVKGPGTSGGGWKGIRIFKSLPVIAADSSSSVADGRIFRFKISANPNGPIAIGKLSFVLNSNTTSLSSLSLHGYTDASYSQPISGQGPEGQIGAGFSSPQLGTALAFHANMPLEIPPGATYYFVLQGVQLGNSSSPYITTTLMGDSQTSALSNYAGQSGNFLWSDNATSTATYGDADWVNSAGLQSLPSDGVSQIAGTFPGIVIPPNRIPIIQSVTPSSGPVGTNITIKGSGFTPTGNHIGYMNGANSSVTLPETLSSSDGSTLEYTIPTLTPGTYSFFIFNQNGSTKNATFTVTGGAVGSVSPVINSASPSTVVDGHTITITGSGFTGSNTILIDNNSYSHVASGDGSTIVSGISSSGGCSGSRTCYYPPLGTHSLAVSNEYGTSNSVTFTLTSGTTAQGPTIASVSPVSGPVGSTATIYGYGFDSGSYVEVDGSLVIDRHLGTSAYTSTSMTFAIPSGMSVGSHTLRVVENLSNLPKSNAVTFTVTATQTDTSAPTCILTASPPTLPAGGVYTLYWNSTNATTQRIVLNTNSISITPAPGTSSGSQQFSPVGTWVMTVSNSYGTNTCQTTVTNSPAQTTPPPLITSIAPMSAGPGASATIYGTHFANISSIDFADVNNQFAGRIYPQNFTVDGDGMQVQFTVPPTTPVPLPSNIPPGNYSVRVVTSWGTSNSFPFTISSYGGTPANPSAPSGYGYVFCAMEGGHCNFPAGTRVDVIYGYGGAWAYKNGITDLGMDCNSSVFGDPAVGYGKACFYKGASAPLTSPVDGYSLCASESQFCNFSGTKDVAYGWNDSFSYKSGVSGGIQCDNSVFGDPKYGFGKSCYIKDSNATIVAPLPPPIIFPPRTCPFGARCIQQEQVLGVSTYQFTRNLAVGYTGSDVSALQEILFKLGFFSGSSTGYFGVQTKQALELYQEKNGIPAMGVVGPLTRTRLNQGE